jgi:hypothetical protein
MLVHGWLYRCHPVHLQLKIVVTISKFHLDSEMIAHETILREVYCAIPYWLRKWLSTCARQSSVLCYSLKLIFLSQILWVPDMIAHEV